MTEAAAEVVLRRCSRCKVEKPLDGFHRRTFRNGRVGQTSECKPCRLALRRALSKTERGKENNRRNTAKHYRKIRALALLARGKALPWIEENADVLRRALVEKPKELTTEEEMAAYFRGFVAGAQRSHGETERFSRLKDLCHRIAAEGGRRGAYETRLSAAYEGLLVFMRRHPIRGFKDEKHERATAAQVIRSTIIDEARSSGDLKRGGERRHVGLALSQLADEDGNAPEAVSEESHAVDGEDLWRELEGSILEGIRRGEVSEHLHDILYYRIQGLTMKESAERIGITESRVCGILSESLPWLRQNVSRLLDRPDILDMERRPFAKIG